jgi:hypothetical protein
MIKKTTVHHTPVVRVFQSDGVPRHFSRCVRAFLKSDREGTFPAPPPRSPDLTPLDFLFWGFVKDILYREEVQNMHELRDRIVRAAKCVTTEMPASTWRGTEYRLHDRYATIGAHIEIY